MASGSRERRRSPNASSYLSDRILPDGCVELIFNYLDPINRLENDDVTEAHSRSFIAGQIKTAIQIQPTGRVGLFGIRFHPHGAYPILKSPLYEFTDKVIALNSVWGKFTKEIEDRILTAQTNRDRVNIIEEILLKRIYSDNYSKDYFVDASVNFIIDHRGLVSIENLSNEIGISRRQLEKKFKSFVGIGPKLFARIIRFQNILKAIDKNRGYDWLSIINKGDYYDQSHLIKDFKAFSGQNPSSYFKEKHLLQNN